MTLLAEPADPLQPSALTVSGVVEGTSFTANIIGCSDVENGTSTDSLSEFSATINWGDGTSSPGTIVAMGGGGIVGGAGLGPSGASTNAFSTNTSFYVVGTHTYADEGTYSASVTVNDIDGTTASLTESINVSDAALHVTAQPISVTEGHAVNTTVATFTDDNPGATASDYAVTINWGDGNSSSGTIVGSSIQGAHAYAEQGSYTVTTTITDVGGSQASGSAAASVVDAPLTLTNALMKPTEGIAFDGAVAILDDANSAAPASDYTVTIHWGDGATSSGTVSGHNVSGSHTYAEEGEYTVSTTVTDEGGSSATLSNLVSVADAPLTLNPMSFGMVEGQSLTTVLATFADANPSPEAADYSATVNWADGRGWQPATISGNQIIGTGLYVEDGTRQVIVRLTDQGGASAATRIIVPVSESAITITSQTLTGALEGDSFALPAFTVHDPNAEGQTAYHVQIDWGDGTQLTATAQHGHDSGNTAGSITFGPFDYSSPGVTFQAWSNHTYSEEGTFTVTIKVWDDDGNVDNPVLDTRQLVVTEKPLQLSDFGVRSSAYGNGMYLWIGQGDLTTDSNLASDPDAMVAIDWGDGSTSSAQASQPIFGTHSYQQNGTYTITVTVTDDNLTATATKTIDVSNPPIDPQSAPPATAPLQGFAFVDTNGDGVYGATDTPVAHAALTLEDLGGNPRGMTTTDAEGYYSFGFLPYGEYVIKEFLAPTGDVFTGADHVGIADTAWLTVDGSGIDVTVAPPPLAQITDVTPAYSATAGFTSWNEPANTTTAAGVQVGESVLTLSYPSSTGTVTTSLNSWGVDLYHPATVPPATSPFPYQVQPVWIPRSTTPSDYESRLGRAGYLYNTYRLAKLSSTDAAGLQLAIWKLIYDSADDLSGGSFAVIPPGPGSPTDPLVYASAEDFLSHSVGKQEYAYFLLPDPYSSAALTPSNPFGMMATELVNVANSRLGSVSGSVYDDMSGTGTKTKYDRPIGGVTVTLSGWDTHNNAVTLTTQTKKDGKYTFQNVLPGTYTLEETTPAGYIDETAIAGSVGGTPTFGKITDVVLGFNQTATEYDFPEDLPPEFTSTAVVQAQATVPFTYTAVAVDPEHDAMHYSLLSAPVGMVIDAQTGVVSWTPHSSDVGSYAIAVQADDGLVPTREKVEQHFTLTVGASTATPPNRPPVFTSTPETSAFVNTVYPYQATANDPDGDTLTFSVVSGPSGFQIDSASGAVHWTPTAAEVGTVAVTVQVADGRGGIATQSYSILVQQEPGNLPPLITSMPVLSAIVGQPYVYQVTAADADGDAPLTYALPLGPSTMTIGTLGGRVEWVPLATDVGTHTVHVTVSDGRGGSDEQDYVVTVTALNELRGQKYDDLYANQLPPEDNPPPTPVTLSTVDTNFDDINSLAYDQSTNSIVASVNSPVGVPRTFERILADGTHVPFTEISGFTDEVEMTTVPQENLGGFTAGDLFCGNGQPGQIARISNGVDVVSPWVTLPGETGLFRGGLTFDTTGLFGGNLIAVTKTGDVWEVTATGVATKLASNLDPFLEGVEVIPDDVAAYGPLAGKIIAPAEDTGLLFAIDPQGNSTSVDLHLGYPESVKLITPGSNFFVINNTTRTIEGAPASEFSSMVGDILLTQEYEIAPGATGLWILKWDGTSIVPVPLEITPNSAPLGNWEDALFAPAGIGAIRPTPGPKPGVPGWTVYLDTNQNGQLDAGEPTTTTDQNGDYAFTGLADGTYTVAEVPETGWTQVAPASHTYTVTVSGGQVIRGLDFGNTEGNPAGPNDVPAFSSTPIVSGKVWSRYQYVAQASDPDHDVLTYSLSVKPTGMVIDPLSGAIDWVPAPGQVGVQDVTVRVKDNRGGVALQTFQVTVTGANSRPVITSHPPAPAEVGVAYKYAVHAVDPDADPLTFELLTGPSGMAIDSQTGILTWSSPVMPASGNTYPVRIRVSDNHNANDEQYFDLPVDNSATNLIPTITSTPRTTIQLGRTYVYQVVANDADGDALTYALVGPPQGMTITAAGLVVWGPTSAQFGSNSFTVQVSDGRGGSVSQPVQVQVVSQGNDAPPKITSTPPRVATVDKSYVYNAEGGDADGDPVTWSLDAAPTGMAIDPTLGVVVWTPTQDEIGPNTVTVRLTDVQGDADTQTFTITVSSTDLPPVITSTPIVETGAAVPYTYAVVATDPENETLTYALTTAPTNMTIDSATGVIQWTDPESANSSYPVVVQVTDTQGNTATQSYTLSVVATTPNQPPSITSAPQYDAAVGLNYEYDVTASDPDGDTPLLFSLSTGSPSWLSINQNTGVLQGVPPANAVGTFSVTVVVTDPALAYGSQTYDLTVTDNHAPTITSAPVTTIEAGLNYEYDVVASDSDGDPLTYHLLTYPSGMTIDATGKITMPTVPSDAGNSYHVQVVATDPAGAASPVQDYWLTVQGDTTPPQIQLEVSTLTATVGDTATFVIVASDDVGIDTLDLTVNGSHVALDDHNSATVVLASSGSIPIVATATDLSGNTATATQTIDVSNPATSTVTATITSPASQNGIPAAVTGPIPILGTSDSPHFASYSLSIAPLGSGDFVTAPFTLTNGGTQAVTNNALATFDPTTLADGTYTLQLVTTDDNAGQITTATAQVIINIEGNLKFSDFKVAFTDLTLPAPGLPITITRSYDSLDSKRRGDFGYGWRLDEVDLNFKVSLTSSPFAGEGIYPAFQDGTRITLTAPGGTPEGFTFEPTADLAYYGSYEYHPKFIPDPGVTDTLTVDDVALLKTDTGYVVGSDANLDPYNPADTVFGDGHYTLTSRDGLVRVLDGATGRVLTETDRNGNTLTFTDSGITSSSGREVTFVRDGFGHITSIIDPRTNHVDYAYSAQGDLVSVTDRNGNPPTEIIYNTSLPHYIDHIIDSFGRTTAQATYDLTTGRLLSVTDAQGNTTEASFDANTLTNTINGPAGDTSTVTYDDLGNITGSVNGQGETTNFGYSGTYLTSQSEVIGDTTLTTSYAYDALGDMVATTDPLGNTTRFTYDEFGNLETATDALGNTTQNTHDSNGNIISASAPGGDTTTYKYDSSGNVTSETTSSGTTTYSYDSLGNLMNSTDQRGVTTTFSYDDNGNELTSQWTWVSPNDSADIRLVSTTTSYNANDELYRTVGPNGTATSFFDADGRVYKTIDVLNGETDFVYDIGGRLIQTTTPDGKISDKTYDSEGRVQYTDDPHLPTEPANGNLMIYDNSGRVIETQRLANVVISIVDTSTAPQSVLSSAGVVLSSTSTYYDSGGRMVETVDSAGHATFFKYDGSGNQVEVDDVVDGVPRSVTSTYDASGRVITSTDALGNTTQYSYDDAGRLIRTTYADGSYSTATYDAFGRMVESTDAIGRVTRFQYDAKGSLTDVLLPGVVDPRTGTWVNPDYKYSYDAYGNLASVRDPLTTESAPGQWTRQTTYEYDQFGRTVSETLPLGQTASWSYNGSGELASSTDFAGNAFEYTYDSLGRLVQKDEYAAGEMSPTTTSTYGYDTYDMDGNLHQSVTTPSGTTDTVYDINGRVVQVTSPQGTIQYGYDPATGLKTSVTTNNTQIVYAYDDLGRMVSATANTLDGATLTTPLVTTYTYDLNNNRLTTSLPNGTQETRTYDALNRLVTLTNTSPSGNVLTSYEYTYDLDSQRMSVVENTGRTVDYSYDNLDRLVAEQITDAVAGNRTFTYTYDLVNNRSASTDSGAPTGEQSLTYAYDDNDRLLNITSDPTNPGTYAAYTYDDNGNTLTVTKNGVLQTTYTWDLENRLIHADVLDPSTGTTHHIDYTYDDSGNRTSETVDGQTTTYLNDSSQAYDQVLEEYAPGGVLAATYVRGLTLLFQDRAGTESYYAEDGLGSTRALTDSSASIAASYSYDAYGNLILQAGATVNEFLFAGQQFDVNLGEYYLRARYYGPVTGTFSSRDSYEGDVSNPLTRNRYAYAGGDPINNLDLDGHEFDLTDLLTTISGGENVDAKDATQATQALRAARSLQGMLRILRAINQASEMVSTLKSLLALSDLNVAEYTALRGGLTALNLLKIPVSITVPPIPVPRSLVNKLRKKIGAKFWGTRKLSQYCYAA